MAEFDKVTTRGGDRGETSLFNGDRRRKDDILFSAMGDVDEVCSLLGILRAAINSAQHKNEILEAQKVLFKAGAELATPIADKLYKEIQKTVREDVDALEDREKALMGRVEIGSRFIIPGQDLMSAQVHVARAVARRAERSVVACIRERGMIHLALCQNYLNRLSDYLFVLAVAVEQGVVR